MPAPLPPRGPGEGRVDGVGRRGHIDRRDHVVGRRVHVVGRRVHVVGRRNHGKTTLVVDLVRELTARGLRVATVKHTGHAHEPDTPGKDSHRHRTAGAAATAFVTPDVVAVYRPRAPGDDPEDHLAAVAADCDILVVEGHKDGPGPKIEVWRAGLGTTPLAAERDDIAALVTDDPVATADRAAITAPVWPRRDIAALADRVLGLADARPRASTGDDAPQRR